MSWFVRVSQLRTLNWFISPQSDSGILTVMAGSVLILGMMSRHLGYGRCDLIEA
jgi:hypothetical protein